VWAGGAYLPVMCDPRFDDSRARAYFSPGRHWCKSAIGPKKHPAEELGGAKNARADQRHGGLSRAEMTMRAIMADSRP